MPYIKVVMKRIDNEGVIDYFSYGSSSPYCVNYEPGKWTSPILRGSKLLVYGDIRHAIHECGLPEITDLNELPFWGKVYFTCEVVFPVRTRILHWLSPDLMPKFWEEKPRVGVDFPGVNWPYIWNKDEFPIYGCDAVRILEPVEITENLVNSYRIVHAFSK